MLKFWRVQAQKDGKIQKNHEFEPPKEFCYKTGGKSIPPVLQLCRTKLSFAAKSQFAGKPIFLYTFSKVRAAARAAFSAPCRQHASR